MSRTYRDKKGRSQYFRWPKTKGVITAEHYAVQEMEEEGFAPPSRMAARGNPSSGKIPDSYDDLHVSAHREVPKRCRAIFAPYMNSKS